MISKKLLIPVLAVVVTGSTFLGFNTLANAQAKTNPMSGLAQAIASKFNLNQTDVQNAISAYMQQQRANWKQNMAQRQKQHFDQLVSQGKITSSQESAILAELAAVQSQFNPSASQGMTQAQRQQAFQNMKNTLTQWANSQGINPVYVLPFGMGNRGGWHNKSVTTPTPTQ